MSYLPAAFADGATTAAAGGFYIFTIITNDTHQIIIFRLAPTTIPVERSLTYNFTTFAHVASHAGMTRWHPVSSLVSNVLPTPNLLSLSLPLQQLGHADRLTDRWTPLVRFIPYHWKESMAVNHFTSIQAASMPLHGAASQTPPRPRARQ